MAVLPEASASACSRRCSTRSGIPSAGFGCARTSRGNAACTCSDYRAGNQTAIRRSYRGNEVRSKRVRRDGDSRALDTLGAEIMVYELQGDLLFAEAETVTRRVMQDADGARVLRARFRAAVSRRRSGAEAAPAISRRS